MNTFEYIYRDIYGMFYFAETTAESIERAEQKLTKQKIKLVSIWNSDSLSKVPWPNTPVFQDDSKYGICFETDTKLKYPRKTGRCVFLRLSAYLLGVLLLFKNLSIYISLVGFSLMLVATVFQRIFTVSFEIIKSSKLIIFYKYCMGFQFKRNVIEGKLASEVRIYQRRILLKESLCHIYFIELVFPDKKEQIESSLSKKHVLDFANKIAEILGIPCSIPFKL